MFTSLSGFLLKWVSLACVIVNPSVLCIHNTSFHYHYCVILLIVDCQNESSLVVNCISHAYELCLQLLRGHVVCNWHQVQLFFWTRRLVHDSLVRESFAWKYSKVKAFKLDINHQFADVQFGFPTHFGVSHVKDAR